MAPQPAPAPRVMLTVEQAADALGIGRTTAFALVKSGELRSLLIGRLRRVPLDEIHAYTARLTADQNPDTTLVSGAPLQPPNTPRRPRSPQTPRDTH